MLHIHTYAHLIGHVLADILLARTDRPVRGVRVAPDISWRENVGVDLVGGDLVVPTAALAGRRSRAQHVALVRPESFAVPSQVHVHATPTLMSCWEKTKMAKKRAHRNGDHYDDDDDDDDVVTLL